MTGVNPPVQRTGRFFGFPVAGAPDPAPTLSNATRQLCCGAYVDSAFANQVIAEVVEDEHRAVPPSLDFDVDPVVRHCYRARRVLLCRDLILAAVAAIGFVLTQGLAVAWFALGGAIILARSGKLRGMSARSRMQLFGVLAVVGAFCACCQVGSTLAAWLDPTAQFGSGNDGYSGYDEYGFPETDPTSIAQDPSALWSLAQGRVLSGFLLWMPVIFALATLSILVLSRMWVYRIMTTELAPGQRYRLPLLPNPRIEQRMGRVRTAQYGNLSVHSVDPFLGAGIVTRLWSFAVPLRARKSGNPVGGNGASGASGSEALSPDAATFRVPINPVRVYEFIRERLLRLRHDDLPVAEHVPGLYLLPHIVANGSRDQDDVLVEPVAKVPYAVATPPAVEAVIRQPQGGLRFYQRVVLGAHGKSVRSRDNFEVVPAQDQQVLVSAFVHVAVEGGMLYTEFATTLLPPVNRRFQLLDDLHRAPDKLLGRAIRDSFRDWPADTVAAPVRAARTVWRMATGGYRMNKAHRASREYRTYDYGARFSVRELGAESGPVTYLQVLDADKYAQLAERAVVDALFSYLDAAGVDTTEFNSRAEFVQNNNYTLRNNTFNGAAAFGQAASASSTGSAAGGARFGAAGPSAPRQASA
jgi:hypothetical protein